MKKIKQAQKRWVIAFIVVVLIIFIVEWMANRNRKTSKQFEDTIQHNSNK